MNIGMVFILIAVSLALSLFVEGAVEYFLGTPFEQIPALKNAKWALIYAGPIVGIGLSYYWQLDLVAAIATVIANLVKAEDFVWAISPVGFIVTGIAIGRGSNYLHDWLQKSLKKPEVPTA